MDPFAPEAAPPATFHPDGVTRAQREYFLLCGVGLLLAAGLLVYSQTQAFAWDEGFHLLTAQLITRGKRPYLDFFFPQAPLNAYWNALWMRLFGDTWRITHVAAALQTSGAAMLTADYVFTRFPAPRWRLGAALSAALLTALNIAVLQFGTCGQAYGACLLLGVAAFRMATTAVNRRNLVWPALTGLFSAAAAGASLLAAPIAPVLLIWMLWVNRVGSRLTKAAAFLGAGVVAALPLIALFVESSRQTWFNVVKYHLFYRQVKWSGAIGHDIFDAMLAWTETPGALLLALLALAGLLFIRFRSDWDRRLRAEFYLCGWIALGLTVHLSSAHPTFARYYLLTVPYLAILAAAGLYWVAERLYAPERPFWPVFLLAAILSASVAHILYNAMDDRHWTELEQVAAKLDQVTPRQALIYGDEQMYFLTRRPPPSGMESEDSHKLEMSVAQAAEFHIVPRDELDRRLRARVFASAVSCDDDEEMEKRGLPEIFVHREKIAECSVFWGLAPAKR